MKVTVTINRRHEIADPEGTTVKRALHDLVYTEVAEVRMDRIIHMDVAGDDPSDSYKSRCAQANDRDGVTGVPCRKEHVERLLRATRNAFTADPLRD